MYLILSWAEQELEDLLNCRVDQLIREEYTTQTVKLRDIIEPTINFMGEKVDTVKHLLQRTLSTPREVIAFFNECIKAAEGQVKISQTEIFAAEAIYSENRLRYLADEWSADYPNLIELARFLKKCPKQFTFAAIDKGNFESFLVDFLATNGKKEDDIYTVIASQE